MDENQGILVCYCCQSTIVVVIGTHSSTSSTSTTEGSFGRADTGMDWSFGSAAVPLTGVCIATMPITEVGISRFLYPGLQ